MASGVSRNNKAFSLIEVILSVAILSLGIFFVIRAFSFSVQATGLYCDILSALSVSKDILQEYEYLEKTQALEKQPQERKQNIGRFGYTAALKQGPDTKTFALDYTISWMRAKKEQRIEIYTLLK